MGRYVAVAVVTARPCSAYRLTGVVPSVRSGCTRTCPCSTLTSTSPGPLRTLKAVPTTVTRLGPVSTVKGLSTSGATWKKASPRSSTTSRCRG
ncbi:hypothetical protein G6F24_018617 [Rhizopus arrhizus]|nr:hypothetical protein G6F24_018617 [Rhizopus arrhizus]